MTQELTQSPQVISQTTIQDIPTTPTSSYQTQGQLAMQPQYQAQVIPFPVYQPTPAPLQQAVSSPSPSKDSSNPWEAAFNKVVSLLSTPVVSPAQAQPSPSPTPQLPGQVNPNNPYSAVNYRQQHQSPQTSQWEQSNPAQYGSNYSQHLPQQQNAYQNVPGRSSAEYASTEELIAQLGPRAAEILNESHCKLEDRLNQVTALLQQAHAFNVQSIQTMQALQPHIERYAAMEQLLTDGNRLAAYTVDYFTYVEPQPDRPNAAASLVRPEFPSMPSGAGQQDGQMQLRHIRPDQRWMVADQMERQGLLKGKTIVVQ